MTQSTLSIPNEAGASFRADNNTALQANATFQSGASAPGTTYADQYWYDTTAQVLKKRNQANSAWIVIGTRDEAFVVSRSTNTVLGLSDFGKTFRSTASFTQTLTAAATLGDGWFCFYRNDFTSAQTIDPNASETIDGATTIALQPGEGVRICCNGTGFFTQGRSGQSTTVQTSGSGTYTTPLGAKRLRVRMVGGGGGGGGGGTGTPGAGGNGGDTTFGTFTAGKGTGGAAASTNSQGGAGGAASGSPTVGIAGGNGGAGSNISLAGGAGGCTPFGGAGIGGTTGGGANSPTAGATNSGSGGGGGAFGTTTAGGAGGGAGAYAEMHINAPAATYSFGVGAAGTAGTTGTNGTAGGAGGSGIIIIEEFY